jgi:hypothetical protein
MRSSMMWMPASSGIARMLADVSGGHAHVFVAGSALDLVTNPNGQECALSDGDVLLLQGSVCRQTQPLAAILVVLASKGGQECPKGEHQLTVQTDRSCKRCRTICGRPSTRGYRICGRSRVLVGCRRLQPSAQAPHDVATGFAAIAPPPTPQDAADLQQQNQQADQRRRT